ncbi:YceI family protein [Panacibacter ginsenosidivorans]|uniref:YceI family protein n=1 Tax=Panacibacter ginsenosidivorans TaxID=1813871 RepID=A0A5B8VAU5_9BACT|nr:YceI family protein [Panacibacter ginsenosidivorans]QEC68001.1 YceI family protein [Panacibacter ginsenosidivorans]
MRKFFTLLLPAFFLVSFISADLKPVDADNAVSFAIKNFGINTNGEFKGLKGVIKWDNANPAASVFNVTVDANTINTGIDMRDDHLRDEDYFNVKKYPVISFVSTAVTAGNITGNLTIKGTTKQVSFPFTVTPSNGSYLFEGSFTINRRDFGIGSSSMSLGNNVTVTLKVQAK